MNSGVIFSVFASRQVIMLKMWALMLYSGVELRKLGSSVLASTPCMTTTCAMVLAAGACCAGAAAAAGVVGFGLGGAVGAVGAVDWQAAATDTSAGVAASTAAIRSN